MKTQIAAILILLGLCSLSFAANDRISCLDLGDGLAAQVGYDGGCKFFYLPGRELPISIPYATWIYDARVSPDRLAVMLVLCVERYNIGSDYLCCLYCKRSDTSATATWTAKFVLHATNLDLMFDRWTKVDSIEALASDGTATLRIARGVARVPPYLIARSSEVWNVLEEKRTAQLGKEER
ncbi:hypothetical protein SAMN02745166_03542 [Prosthecobacter debontii]|uniref:Uncharacterized protein n=1 Tax=Prosthecobacter debontii TaxID=48467 RepID=A0A1T4YK75_9BACT|nr:hypothetical protein [Prosthecobacter debontii]SKB02100.1 hypothetical protein SAMN02745166_03542 [Prosthecobacter debontii]